MRLFVREEYLKEMLHAAARKGAQIAIEERHRVRGDVGKLTLVEQQRIARKTAFRVNRRIKGWIDETSSKL